MIKMEGAMRIIFVVLSLCIIFSAIQIANVIDGLNSGKFMAVLKPQIILSEDCPWESMPPMIKEYISANAELNTNLDKKDMLQLAAYYQKLAADYKKPIVLRDQKDYPKKKEVSK